MLQQATDTIDLIKMLCQKSIADGEFSYGHNEELEKYCAVLSSNSHVDTWIPLLFELTEEFSEDVDLTLGSPGPIVHAIEKVSPKYQIHLVASLARKPTGISLWMAERIYRTPGNDLEFWAKELKAILVHPKATTSAIEDPDWINDL